MTENNGRIYDKLVRDDIPERIEEDGMVPETKTIDGAEYWEYLVDKLYEEVEEYETSGETEELADILEVLYALGAVGDVAPHEIEKERADKYRRVGGFDNGVVLEAVRPAQ